MEKLEKSGASFHSICEQLTHAFSRICHFSADLSGGDSRWASATVGYMSVWDRAVSHRPYTLPPPEKLPLPASSHRQSREVNRQTVIVIVKGSREVEGHTWPPERCDPFQLVRHRWTTIPPSHFRREPFKCPVDLGDRTPSRSSSVNVRRLADAHSRYTKRQHD